MRTLLLLPLLLLAACSQAHPTTAASPPVSIEARLMIIPSADYSAMAAKFPRLPAAPTAKPRVAVSRDNYQLSLLLRATQSSPKTTTITAPRASAEDHTPTSIAFADYRNFVYSGPADMRPSPVRVGDPRSGATFTPVLLSHDRIRLTAKFHYTADLFDAKSTTSSPPATEPSTPPRTAGFTVTVPDGSSLIFGPLSHPQHPEKVIVVLVRPKIVRETPAFNGLFGPGHERPTGLPARPTTRPTTRP